jgi:GNAT superfamily N-acetyltransferase
LAGLRFFQPAVGSETDAAFQFYQSFQTEFLWPRTLREIEEMAEDGQLFAAAEGGRFLACCYMKPDDGDGYEFGGVLVDEAARGRKVGSTLGRVALAVVSAMASPDEIIAHVHEENELPRPLLQRLGFVPTGTKDGPPDAPPGMKRNAEGKVVGDVYKFDFSQFVAIADWLDAFHDEVAGVPAELSVIVDRVAVVADLRVLAGRR